MHVAGVSVNNAKKYFKNVEEQSHSTSAQSLEQFIVLLKLKGTF